MALWLLCQWLDYNNINAVVLDVATYKLTDATLTLTIGGKQYPFRRTSGIRLDVKEFPPALFEK